MKSPESVTMGQREAPPRERILAAARELFYARGIRAVGVDEIAAAAHTNKMTLYRHFQSKDQLVAAYVRALAADADSLWDELARAHPGEPLAQLRDWIARIGALAAGGRGCAIANAAVEIPDPDHPARAAIEAHKTHHRAQLARLCGEAGFEEPERVADELFLLLEGARISVQSVGRCGPGARFAQMAGAMLAAHKRRAN